MTCIHVPVTAPAVRYFRLVRHLFPSGAAPSSCSRPVQQAQTCYCVTATSDVVATADVAVIITHAHADCHGAYRPLFMWRCTWNCFCSISFSSTAACNSTRMYASCFTRLFSRLPCNSKICHISDVVIIFRLLRGMEIHIDMDIYAPETCIPAKEHHIGRTQHRTTAGRRLVFCLFVHPAVVRYHQIHQIHPHRLPMCLHKRYLRWRCHPPKAKTQYTIMHEPSPATICKTGRKCFESHVVKNTVFRRYKLLNVANSLKFFRELQ